MRKRNVFLKILVFVLVLVSLNTAPAHAWKVKTHVYSANLILEEARNGYVEIKPYGKFEVLPEYLSLLNGYPEYFRAGALGPDLLPDIIIGQTIFHPGNTSYTSGEFISIFWNKAKSLPDYVPSETEMMIRNTINSTLPIQYSPPGDKNDPANDYLTINTKDQAKAFALGLQFHAAGDYFGHSYINNWAKGSWPNMMDGMNSQEKDIIKRHSVIEAYIDSKIPTKYKDKYYNTIKVPQRFVFDTMLVGGGVNIDRISSDYRYAEYFGNIDNVPEHMDLFFTIRDACKRRINKINANADGDLWDKAVYGISLQFAQKAYCEAWIKDIDRGLGDWVVANERAAQKMILDGNGMKEYKEELTKWKDKHLLSMLGAPDVAVSVLNALGSVTDFVMDILPDFIEREYKEAKQDILNYAVKKAFSIDLEELMTLLDPPLEVLKTGNLFPTGSFEKLNAEMGNFNTSTNSNDQTFIPFKNSLTLMKLILIGDEGIDKLRMVAGSTSTVPNPYKKSTLIRFVHNMDYGYDWGVNPLDQFYLSYSSDEDRNKIVNVIFDLYPDKVKPTFSDMTKGPIEIVPGPRHMDSVPNISVKYYDAPDQVNATIGIYEVGSSWEKAESWKNIARNISGDYSVSVPIKAGKYQFRIYDNKRLLQSVSDTIEVVEKVGDNKSYFSKVPTQPVEINQSGFNYEYMNVAKKNGFIALYKENENDPSKFNIGFGKSTFGEKSSIYSYMGGCAPETPGNYQLRAYDINNNLLVQSSIIVVIGNPNVQVPPTTPDSTKLPIIITLDADDLVLSDYQGQNTVLNVTITGKTNGNVWGNGIYSDDSDIATAAVHAGIVMLGEKKIVKITILPGQNSYEGTMRNGVQTQNYEEWAGSFKFTDVTLPLTSQGFTESFGSTINADDISLEDYRGQSGKDINLVVTGRNDLSIWGTDIYSDDSDINTAAVHAGIVKVGETKTVKITILPGQSSYIGSVRNGIESYEYVEFEGSFKFSDITTTPAQ